MRSTLKVNHQAARRGSALVASVVVVLMLSVMGAALVQIQAARTRRQVQSVDNVRALYVAEAGLSEAFLAVSEGKSGMVACEAQPASFGDGIYWVEAAEHPDGQVLLRSNAFCGVGRFSLALVLQRETNPVAKLGFFGEEGVEVQEGAVVDGFDSREGSFDKQVDKELPLESTGISGRVGSNGEIRVKAQQSLLGGAIKKGSGDGNLITTIYGDVVPGPEGSVVLDPGAIVTGSTAPSNEYSSLPEVVAPDLPTPLLQLPNTLTGNWGYKAIKIRAGQEVTIQGPATIATQALHVETGGTLIFNTDDGQIALYCTGVLSIAEGAVLENTSQDTSACALLLSGNDLEDHNGDGEADPAVIIRGSGVYYGQILAPHASISLPKELRFYGSIAAEKLVLEAGSRVSFDSALALSSSVLSGLPALISWHVVDLPESKLVQMRADALEVLKVNGIVPEPSSQAHIERSCKLTYVDTDGLLHIITDNPSNLDWANVSQIVDIVWFDKNGREVKKYGWLRGPLNQAIKTTYDALEVGGVDPVDLFPVQPQKVK